MAVDVAVLPTPIKIAQDQCVWILEEALADARAGRVAAVALAVVEPSGHATTTASSTTQVYALLGAVSMLGHRLMVFFCFLTVVK